MAKPPILVHGLHGLGDNLHQRAFLAQLLETHEVWLESSWVSLYHDLVEKGLHVIRKRVSLRTQSKNAEREAALFSKVPVPPATPAVNVSYNGYNVARMPNHTILEAMCGSINMGIDFTRADFRLPIPPSWFDAIDSFIETWKTTKPILVYRPLVVRTEWRGNDKRNADPQAYAEIFASIRDRFFVVSVADLIPGREWIVGPQLKPDVTLHAGELVFEPLAALFARARLVYTSSGFATLLAQAVSTPNISVIGLYELASHHAGGAAYAPYLGVEPIKPCNCQYSGCTNRCSKQIDTPTALVRVIDFVNTKVYPWSDYGPPEPALIQRPITEMFDPPSQAPQLAMMQRAQMRRGGVAHPGAPPRRIAQPVTPQTGQKA